MDGLYSYYCTSRRQTEGGRPWSSKLQHPSGVLTCSSDHFPHWAWFSIMPAGRSKEQNSDRDRCRKSWCQLPSAKSSESPQRYYRPSPQLVDAVGRSEFFLSPRLGSSTDERVGASLTNGADGQGSRLLRSLGLIHRRAMGSTASAMRYAQCCGMEHSSHVNGLVLIRWQRL